MAEKADAGAGGRTRAERSLVRLVYVSIAAPKLGPADLSTIEAVARERNRLAGLTGLLLHQRDGFFGLLEGPRRRLFACMERIITDERHARMEILFETTAAARRFTSWSFASLPACGLVERPTAAEDFIRSLGRRLGRSDFQSDGLVR